MCVVVVYPPPTHTHTQCEGVLVCVVCGETHRQHSLVVTPVTSLLRGTHPPVSSTAVIWREEEGSVDWFVWMVLIEGLLITLPVKVLADGVFLDVDLKVSGDIASCTASVVSRAC